MGKGGWIKTVILLAGVAAGAIAQQQAQEAVGGFTELQRGQVPGEADLELVMGLVERTGRSVSPKHYHPGGEFGFVLEGTATIVTATGPPVTVEAGASFYQPPGEWHIVQTGSGATKAVVFRPVRRGEAMIVEVE